MKSKLLAHPIRWLLMLLPAATFAEVTPYPPYPGAVPSAAVPEPSTYALVGISVLSALGLRRRRG